MTRVLLPLKMLGDASSWLPAMMTVVLRAEPQAVIEIGERWRLPREPIVLSGLVVVELQISGASLFVSPGPCRLDHALECASGHRVKPGQTIDLRIVNVASGAVLVPPLGWFAHTP